jgi:hypothetical protein
MHRLDENRRRKASDAERQERRHTLFLNVGGVAGEDLGLRAFDSRVDVGRSCALDGIHGGIYIDEMEECRV